MPIGKVIEIQIPSEAHLEHFERALFANRIPYSITERWVPDPNWCGCGVDGLCHRHSRMAELRQELRRLENDDKN